jgi:hypothetical protein
VGHAEIRIGDSLIILGQAGEQWQPRNSELYLWVDKVDEAYRKASAAGATGACGITWWIGSPAKSTTSVQG